MLTKFHDPGELLTTILAELGEALYPSDVEGFLERMQPHFNELRETLSECLRNAEPHFIYLQTRRFILANFDQQNQNQN